MVASFHSFSQRIKKSWMMSTSQNKRGESYYQLLPLFIHHIQSKIQYTLTEFLGSNLRGTNNNLYRFLQDFASKVILS